MKVLSCASNMSSYCRFRMWFVLSAFVVLQVGSTAAAPSLWDAAPHCLRRRKPDTASVSLTSCSQHSRPPGSPLPILGTSTAGPGSSEGLPTNEGCILAYVVDGLLPSGAWSDHGSTPKTSEPDESAAVEDHHAENIDAYLRNEPWTRSPCVADAVSFHLVHAVCFQTRLLGEESHLEDFSKPPHSGTRRSCKDQFEQWRKRQSLRDKASAISGVGPHLSEQMLEVLSTVPFERLGQFFVTVAALFGTSEVLALKGHTLAEDYDRHTSDFFLFRDWVANHLYHGILPPLADAVHYLEREKSKRKAGALVPRSNRETTESPPKLCWPHISKAIGYLVVALSMLEIQPESETRAVMHASEELMKGNCFRRASNENKMDETTSHSTIGTGVDFQPDFAHSIFHSVDPLYWTLLATLHVRLGDALPPQNLFWGRALLPTASSTPRDEVAEARIKRQELLVPVFEDDAAVLDSPASFQSQQNTAAAPATDTWSVSPAPVQQQLFPAGTSAVNAAATTSTESNYYGEKRAENEKPGAGALPELEQYDVFAFGPEMRQNCFTKQGNDIFAAYEDNLVANCLGGRSIVQFFIWNAARNRLEPLPRTSGGYYVVQQEQINFSIQQQGQARKGKMDHLRSGNGVELQWQRSTEFGRRRLLVRDPLWLYRRNLYVSLASPEVRPVLVVEEKSAADTWNREWLESFLQAMQELGHEPTTVQAPEQLAFLLRGRSAMLSASGGHGYSTGASQQSSTPPYNPGANKEEKDKPTNLAVFWRTNQMFQGRQYPAGPQLSDALHQYTQAFEQLPTTRVFPDPETAKLYQNKLPMLEAFIANGIPVARFRVVSRQELANGQIDYELSPGAGGQVSWPSFPVLLKHAFAASSRGLAQCDSFADLRRCLQRWFDTGNPDQEVVIVQEKLTFRRELRVTFIAGEVVHGYWRIKEHSSDMAASTHISNSTLSFDDLPLELLRPVVEQVSRTIMAVGAMDVVLLDDEQGGHTPKLFVFEVSPIFDMNPEPESAALKAIPYSDYKKTSNYVARRLEGYKHFCKRFISYGLEVVRRATQIITLYVDIDNTLNYAFRRHSRDIAGVVQRYYSDAAEILATLTSGAGRNDARLVVQDEAVGGAADILKQLQQSGRYRIVYLTARLFPAAIEVTHHWLFALHGFPAAPVLFTRSANEKITHLLDEADDEGAHACGQVGTTASMQKITTSGRVTSIDREIEEVRAAMTQLQEVQSLGGATAAESSSTSSCEIIAPGSPSTSTTRSSTSSKLAQRGVKRILIDDFTRAHDEPQFAWQHELLGMLERHQVSYIRLQTHRAADHWNEIRNLLLSDASPD
ncbi:unnamed protein product [Amoebophrya sp. A25]|nr:unnamed protein product [Amoebophrya sp. A25]|eukprot:GSA25T00014001001.1